MSDLPILKFYNTMTRRLDELKPVAAGQIGIYCCGPTVYDYQHIGNFKTFIFEDLLVRTLRFAGYGVKYVMNITDVGHLVGDGDEGEDKMAVAMRREKKKSHEIAEFYSAKFFEDWDKLGLLRPDIVCKATEHICDMIELIRRIEKNGFTYQAGGNVYFDVGKFPAYGKMALLDLGKLQAGARIEVDPNKRNPFDFVLWFTKSKFENQELLWDSPWGRGYPGWHIECSAMSMKYLGEQFDIHCGGADHVQVHHTNEIAQSEAATGKPWVSIWMHSEFMNINSQKMSKSLGNLVTLDDLIKDGFPPEVFRFTILSSHYRSHLNFNREVMENGASGLNKLKNAVLALKETGAAPAARISQAGQKYLEDFKTAVYDDLNIPRSLAAVWAALGDRALAEGDRLALCFGFDEILGLGMRGWEPEKFETPQELKELLKKREAARKAKNWALSDSLREDAAVMGFDIEDSAQGQKVRKKQGA